MLRRILIEPDKTPRNLQLRILWPSLLVVAAAALALYR